MHNKFSGQVMHLNNYTIEKSDLLTYITTKIISYVF